MIRTATTLLVAGLAAAALATPTEPDVGSSPPPTAPAPAFELPLPGDARVVHPFAAPASLFGPGHRGVDLAADVDAVVRAPAAGTVAFAGTVVDRGVVTVSHDGGLRSSLEPVSWSVHPGERVERGEPIGVVQAVAGHCAPAACVHWGVRRGATYVDPLGLVAGARPGPVVLLPGP